MKIKNKTIYFLINKIIYLKINVKNKKWREKHGN